MSWFGSAPTEKVFHPDGNFNMNAIIDEIFYIESRGYKPSAVVMTAEQRRECLCLETRKRLGVGVDYGKQINSIFGLDIEISECSKRCVCIDKEF